MPVKSSEVSRSKYEVLADDLRSQIERGHLSPGDRLPSFGEMCATHGIALATVERVYRRLEEEGLVLREHRRGTFVAPRRQRKGIIGCVGVEFASRTSYWMHLMDGIQAAARRAGSRLLLLDATPDEVWNQVDGVLRCCEETDWLFHLPASLPCVSLVFAQQGFPYVTADDYAGARAATEHLLFLGHRKIAFMPSGFNAHSGEYYPPAANRLRGYCDALKSAGIKIEQDWVRPLTKQFSQGEGFVGRGRGNMLQWLDEGWEDLGCTAIFVHNDEAAIGVMEVLEESGKKIPEEVSVVGFDGIQPSRSHGRSLTTVEVPLEEIGARGVEMLLRQIEGDEVEPVTLPTQVRVRQSSAPVRQ